MLIGVVGAAGFVGKHVVSLARSRGVRVRAIVRRSGCEPASWLASSPRVEVTQIADESSADGAEAALRDVETLVYLAVSGVDVGERSISRVLRGNVMTAALWVDAARRAGVRRVIATGTSAEYAGYGRLPDEPWASMVAPKLKENAPLGPADAYAATKTAAGIWMAAMAREHGLELFYLRVCNLYGVGDRAGRLIPSATRALAEGRWFAASPGEQVREWLAVEDAAAAIVAACEAKLVQSPLVLNIGTGVGTQQAALLKHLARLAGRDTDLIQLGARSYRAHEWHHLVMDCGRAREVLGWHPCVSLEEGLARFVGAELQR